jgi:hypothetical protein
MTAVRLTVAAQPAVALAACELCAVGPVTVADAVVIYRADGATVTLAACERCARSARRIFALVGHDTSTITADAGTVQTVVTRSVRPRRLPAAPELIMEFVEQVTTADGTPYVVRVYGQPRTDGTWVGWLEFVAVGAAIVLRTSTETTQSNRAALAYWAAGLEPTYLQGAFARARRRGGHRTLSS